MKTLTQERIGELMVFGETILYSLFPVLIAHTTKLMPPILFASACMIASSISIFIYMLLTKQLKNLKNPQAIKYSLIISLFIVIIPSILIFTGSSKTSGINTSILIQTEILFTLLIFGGLRIEKITTQKILGAILVFFGAILVVFNSTFNINPGDLLIIAGVSFYSIGNIYAKKALKITTPSTILFIRSLFGGLILLAISLLFEKSAISLPSIKTNLPFILITGIVIYHISKALWYEGIKRMDITKAIPISVGGGPLLSLIFSIILLKEVPTIFQILGFIAILAGISIIIFKNKNAQLNA